MFKRLFFVLLLLVTLFFGAREVGAVENPLAVPNNKFGIHIVDTNDLEDASRLVNSNGGDWGYVTLVIQEGERSTERWNKVFEKLRVLRLIPLVRIATQQENGGWQKPKPEEIDNWVSFLGSLNWVTKNRYVIIANEPNHAKEWGGEVRPEEYARYLKLFGQKLKAANSDFFVLPAGLDASAPNSRATMDEAHFIKWMLATEPDVFEYLDGWTSHSYPNPGFSGSEFDEGRGTIRTFEWETELLGELGVNQNWPIFITETGWAHNKNGELRLFPPTTTIGQKMSYAFRDAWSDPRIVAVTPFILNYNEAPFDIFSWKADDGLFYDFYGEVSLIPKVKGEPVFPLREEKKDVTEELGAIEIPKLTPPTTVSSSAEPSL